MKLQKIIDVIEKFAPSIYQESYDNSRLLTGNNSMEIRGALLALDCTEEIIDEAIENDCNLILCHHPIIFSGLKKITGSNYVERVIIKAIKNDIAIFACHTNLDNVYQGVNQKIASKIGLVQTEILSPHQGLLKKLITYCPNSYAEKVRTGLFAAGAGKIGNYDCCSFNSEGTGTFKGNENANPFAGEKNNLHYENEIKIEVIYEKHLQNQIINALKSNHPYEEVAFDIYSIENSHPKIGSGLIGELKEEENEKEFLQRIKKIFNCESIRHTALLGKKVKRIAVCGGSGSFLLNPAISSGADIFISADFKYHQFFDADNKIVIADIGHYESEQFTTEIFYDVIQEKLPKFAVRLTKKNSNPINYL